MLIRIYPLHVRGSRQVGETAPTLHEPLFSAKGDIGIKHPYFSDFKKDLGLAACSFNFFLRADPNEHFRCNIFLLQQAVKEQL